MGSMAKKRRYHHGDLRRALIEAAVQLVAERGVDGLTLRAAARRVGVTHAAPYRHFSDKDALIAAVAEQGFRRMVRFMHQARDEAEPEPFLQLQAIGVAYVEFALAHPSHFRVMFGPKLSSQVGRYDDLRSSARNAFGLLVETIRSGQRNGVVRDGDSRELAVTAWSVVHGLSALLIDGHVPGENPEQVLNLARNATYHLHIGFSPSDQHDHQDDERK